MDIDASPRYLGTTIRASAQDVYMFVAAPENLSQWASGLGAMVRQANGEWIANGPGGPVRVRFCERNGFGVLDHWVTAADGMQATIPLRVVAQGDHSNIMLTLFRRPGMSDAQFDADADWVRRDLAALKKLLETKTDSGDAG